MGIDLQYEDGPGYLIITGTGEWNESNAKEAITNAAEEAHKRNMYKLLVNLHKLSAPDGEMTRFFSGEYIAEMFRPPFKIAIVSIPEKITKYAETVAQNRGAVMAVFIDEAEAKEWLLSDEE